MPLTEVSDKTGTLAPAHNVTDVPKLNIGVMFGFTETVNVVLVAHWPPAGVNV
jgi:hypothetical protein